MSTNSTRRAALLVGVLVAATAACGTATADPGGPGPAGVDPSPPDAAVSTPPRADTTVTTPAPAVTEVPQVTGLKAMVDVEGRLATHDGDGSFVVHERGLVSADGLTAVVVEAGGATTVLRWITLETGDTTASIELAGDLVAVASTTDAHTIALVDDAGAAADGAIAAGRTSTDVVVASPAGELFRRRIDGNIVPEAFSAWTQPGTTVPGATFVIDHQPPEQPTRYRVRVLDLATGELTLPFNLRDKVQAVDQLMAGISRTSVVASEADLLFTLYRGHHDEGVGSYAFIHTLAFGGGVWCLEVPVGMELADRAGALAMAPDGRDLLAVSANGTIASIAVESIIDFERMPVFGPTRSLGAVSSADVEGAPAVATGVDSLHVGLGTTLFEVDPGDLSVRASSEMPIHLEAVDASDAGVVAVGDGRVLLVADGAVAAESSVPVGLGTIVRVVAD